MDDIKAMMNDRDMPDSQKLDMIDAYRRSIDKEKLKISTGTKSENGLLSNYILFSQNNVPVILDNQSQSWRSRNGREKRSNHRYRPRYD